jgi:LacI family transcriptional regulator
LKKQRERRVTSRDVARRAQVSQSTVSLVLNKRAESIPEGTRLRVLDAARQLSYVPNAAARALRTRRHNRAGVVVSDISVGFFSRIVKGIQHVANDSDMSLIVYDQDFHSRNENDVVDLYSRGDVDGLIVVSSSRKVSNRPLEKLKDLGVPLVLVNRSLGNPEAYTLVGIDRVSGARNAVQHLISLGERTIGFLVWRVKGAHALRSDIDRLEGYRAALVEAGISYDPSLVVECMRAKDGEAGGYPAEFLYQGGYQATKRLLRKGVTAFYTCHEYFAMGLYRSVVELGLSMPGQVQVISNSSMYMAPFTTPRLSTVEEPAFEAGTKAGALLLRRLDGTAQTPEQITLQSPLIIRESCRGR